MEVINQFTLIKNYIMCIILLSICDILHCQRLHELELKFCNQLTTTLKNWLGLKR